MPKNWFIDLIYINCNRNISLRMYTLHTEICAFSIDTGNTRRSNNAWYNDTTTYFPTKSYITYQSSQRWGTFCHLSIEISQSTSQTKRPNINNKSLSHLTWVDEAVAAPSLGYGRYPWRRRWVGRWAGCYGCCWRGPGHSRRPRGPGCWMYGGHDHTHGHRNRGCEGQTCQLTGHRQE